MDSSRWYKSLLQVVLQATHCSGEICVDKILVDSGGDSERERATHGSMYLVNDVGPLVRVVPLVVGF
jgi:hypothetical protein